MLLYSKLQANQRQASDHVHNFTISNVRQPGFTTCPKVSRNSANQHEL